MNHNSKSHRIHLLNTQHMHFLGLLPYLAVSVLSSVLMLGLSSFQMSATRVTPPPQSDAFVTVSDAEFQYQDQYSEHENAHDSLRPVAAAALTALPVINLGHNSSLPVTCLNGQIALTRDSTYTKLLVRCYPKSGPTSTPPPASGAQTTPTRIPTLAKAATITPTPPTSGGSEVPATAPAWVKTALASVAYGTWNPDEKLADGSYKYRAPNEGVAGLPQPKYPTCTKVLHDSFFVIGPDGKKYPAWHPPVVTDPASGKKCAFGHEHGRDPRLYEFYTKLQKHFAYDANKNATVDTDELAWAGIPFGYANESLDAQNIGVHRHEDHVGHKVQFVNGERDLLYTEAGETDRAGVVFDNSPTGGAVVRQVSSRDTLGQSNDHVNSGIRCYTFNKFHQGVHSPDAFTHGQHELISHKYCYIDKTNLPVRTDVTDNTESITTTLIEFGPEGSFVEFCSGTSFGRNTEVTPDTNTFIPRGDGPEDLTPFRLGIRNIPTHRCNGNSAKNLTSYEIWSGNVRIRKANGAELLTIPGGGWEILDTMRYYDPAKPNKIAYTADVCTGASGFDPGPGCNVATDYGRIKFKWNDSRSPFRGVHRGQYMTVHQIQNQGGSEYVYTDSFGDMASPTPFPGSIKQYISAKNVTITGRGSVNIDPVNLLYHMDDGEGTVHAPN